MTDVITQPLSRAAAHATVPATAGVEVVSGRAHVLGLLAEYDLLARRCRVPVTARQAWLGARLAAQPTAAPWAVVVRGRDGQLLAAAVLLEVVDESGRRVVLAGGGEDYRAGIAALDSVAARRLAVALSAELARRPGGPALELGPVSDDETARWLAATLGADVVACDPVPWVRSGEDRDVSAYLSHGMRKTLRKARNRMVTDGLVSEVRFTSDRATVVALLPEMERAYRDRDREHGLPCLLDSPAGLRFWRGRVLRLLDAGCLEAATLTVDGRLAAYVLGVRDGNRYGVLEGRFVTELSRYAPGRLLEAAVLQRVLDDDRFVGLDWMTGVAPETLIAANETDRTVVLRRPARDARRVCRN